MIGPLQSTHLSLVFNNSNGYQDNSRKDLNVTEDFRLTFNECSDNV